MDNDHAHRSKRVTKKIIKIQIIGGISAALVGLSAYGIWGADGHAFHPLLNNPKVTYSMLGTGIIGMIWEIDQLIPLLKALNNASSQSGA